MTQKEVLKAIKALPGMTAKYLPEWQEYRVAYLGPDSEASAYYTSDQQDALDTALAMAKHRANQCRDYRQQNPEN